MPFLDLTFYGNDIRTWLIAAVVFVAILAILQFIRRIVVRQYVARLTRDKEGIKFACPTQTLHLPQLEGELLRDGRKNS